MILGLYRIRVVVRENSLVTSPVYADCEVKCELDKVNSVNYIKSTMRRWKGEEIREFRHRFTLTQKNLSELLGVTRTYVILLEKGVKTPSKTLRLLLNYVEKDLTGKQKRKEDGYGKTKVKRRTSH